jgi:hypothetical protein
LWGVKHTAVKAMESLSLVGVANAVGEGVEFVAVPCQPCSA